MMPAEPQLRQQMILDALKMRDCDGRLTSPLHHRLPRAQGYNLRRKAARLPELQAMAAVLEPQPRTARILGHKAGLTPIAAGHFLVALGELGVARRHHGGAVRWSLARPWGLRDAVLHLLDRDPRRDVDFAAALDIHASTARKILIALREEGRARRIETMQTGLKPVIVWAAA